MIKPKGLKRGDTVGLIAPSSPTTDKKYVEQAKDKLIEMGFKVKVGRSCYERYGYLSGTDELRAKDINLMFEDKEVQGIICLRGGYGTPRILDLIDYEIIRNNPKVFVGYSDITALHISMNQISKLVTFHGPMGTSDIIGTFSDFSRDSLFNSILDNGFKGNLDNPHGEEIITINEGIGKGEIIGGNLSLIVDTIGTPYEIDTRGKLLFIEEVSEDPYKVDRMFTQLRLSGKLSDANGIILGDFNKCDREESKHKESLSLMQVIEDIIKPVGKPTIYNFQAGHCEPMITIPFGVEAVLDGYKKEVTILEDPVV